MLHYINAPVQAHWVSLRRTRPNLPALLTNLVLMSKWLSGQTVSIQEVWYKLYPDGCEWQQGYLLRGCEECDGSCTGLCMDLVGTRVPTLAQTRYIFTHNVMPRLTIISWLLCQNISLLRCWCKMQERPPTTSNLVPYCTLSEDHQWLKGPIKGWTELKTTYWPQMTRKIRCCCFFRDKLIRFSFKKDIAAPKSECRVGCRIWLPLL